MTKSNSSGTGVGMLLVGSRQARVSCFGKRVNLFDLSGKSDVVLATNRGPQVMHSIVANHGASSGCIIRMPGRNLVMPVSAQVLVRTLVQSGPDNPNVYIMTDPYFKPANTIGYGDFVRLVKFFDTEEFEQIAQDPEDTGCRILNMEKQWRFNTEAVAAIRSAEYTKPLARYLLYPRKINLSDAARQIRTGLLLTIKNTVWARPSSIDATTISGVIGLETVEPCGVIVDGCVIRAGVRVSSE